MDHLIEMKSICKDYELGGQQLQVLKSIGLRVDQGEFVAVLGPSGSGKSTLMNIVGCMDRPSSGEYHLAGQAIHNMNDDQLTQVRNRQIGFVFQKYHLIPQYNVLQNIIMPLLIRGMKGAQAKQQALGTIRMLGLDDRLLHKPSELSGGQQQRVAIARALVGSPSILLADEPTGALDSKTGQEVLALFSKLHREGNTIIMITHDLNVAACAQRIVRIVDGELFAQAGEQPMGA